MQPQTTLTITEIINEITNQIIQQMIQIKSYSLFIFLKRIFYLFKMTEKLIKTENPVIDEIVESIYNKLMNEVLHYNEILDFMVSIKFTGRLYDTILEAYIGDVPRMSRINQRLFNLIKQNLNSNPVCRSEYRSLIIKYLNQKLTKARETLCTADVHITETIKNKNKWTHCYKFRTTLKGPFIEIIVLMTNNENLKLSLDIPPIESIDNEDETPTIEWIEPKTADYIISQYKQLYFPGAYYHQYNNDVYFSLYMTFPKIESVNVD